MFGSLAATPWPRDEIPKGHNHGQHGSYRNESNPFAYVHRSTRPCRT